jgi:hypothetical protein
MATLGSEVLPLFLTKMPVAVSDKLKESLFCVCILL